jgi:hypothetical protein
VKKWGLVPGVGTGPPTGLRQWTRQHFARTRRGCLPSFYRVLSQRELTSVASCAASEKVVIFHQPTFPFTRFPTATYPHRPQARKGPFLMIAITFPIHDRSHTAKRRCEPFISPSRRQTPFDHDRRPDSELASVRGQTVALPDSTCTPATRPRQTIATSLCRRYQARCHHWHRADPRVGSDAGISWIDPPAYSSLDAYTYRDGVHPDLPAEVLAAALEHGTIPATAIATNRSRRSRKRRETGS